MAHVGTVGRLSEGEHRVQLRRAVIASTIGTAIEWYDFFLYSTATGLVFAKLFFPNSDPLVGTDGNKRPPPKTPSSFIGARPDFDSAFQPSRQSQDS